MSQNKCSLANADAATWFDERKHQYATWIFLNANLQRYGHISNNAAEATNSAIVNIRQLPIVDMCVMLARRNSKQFYTRSVYFIK